MERDITLPVANNLVRGFHAGDILHISGTIFTGRDAAHHLLIKRQNEEKEIPFDIRQMPLYHCGPLVRKRESRWQIIAAGPTTSMRMDRFTGPLLEQYGIRAILGKGGLSQDSVRLMQHYGACYLAIVGGAASLQTTQIEEIEAVYWEDLMPECLWQIRYKGLGPLTVAIDSHGNNLYGDVNNQVNNKRQRLYAQLGITKKTDGA